MNIKSIAIMLALAIPAGAHAQDALQWSQTDRYAAANDSIIRAGARPAIVLLGNSITDIWPDRNSHIFDIHPEITGRGISGQTTSQMLLRFDADVVALHPKAVVINGGTNDIALNAGTYSEDLTLSNIRSMTAIARAHGIAPVLTSVLPAAGFKWRKEVTDAITSIQSLNSRIAAYAKAEGLPYIDYFSVMVNADRTAMKPEYSDERPAVHPNSTGYTVMESLLLPVLAPYLK